MAHSDKLNSEASKTEQSPAEKGLGVQIRQYVVSNLLAVIWNLSLFAGGLIFLIYFASIGFMPQLDFKALITLLAASAITGGFLLLVLGVLLLLPGLSWRFSALGDERLKPLWYRKNTTPWYQEKTPLCHYLKGGYALEAVDHVDYPNPIYPEFQFLPGWPLPPILADKFYSPLCAGLWFGSSTTIATAIFVLASIIFKPEWIEIIALFAAPFIVASGIVFISRRTKLSGSFNKWCPETTLRWRAAINFACYLLFSTFAFLVPLLLLIGFAGAAWASGEEHEFLFHRAVLIAVFAIIVIIGLNTAVAALETFSFSQYLTFFTLAVSSVFIIFGNWNFISKRVMEIYNFGKIENASLVVDEVGCIIAKQYGSKVEADSLDRQTCFLPNMNIHSRLGNVYYVEVPNDPAGAFTIPRQHVLSWSPPELKE